MKIRTKEFNRAMSFVYLGLIVIALAITAFLVVNYISTYKRNQELIHIRDQLIEDMNNQRAYTELHLDEYYSIIVEDKYALFSKQDGEPLIVFSK